MYDKSPGKILEFHRSMLADEERTGRFRQAIAAVVKPGDEVLDLGCGTGILSFFACRAGARRVYAIEHGSVIEIAKQVCRHIGLDEQVGSIEEGKDADLVFLSGEPFALTTRVQRVMVEGTMVSDF